MEVEMGEINVKSVVATRTHTHRAMHQSCCHLAGDPCKGGVFPHLREGSLTAQVLHQYTVEGRWGGKPRSECLSQEISRSQSTRSKGGGVVWEATTNIWQISMKYVQLHHNTVFNRVSNILKKIGVENLVIENILGDRKGEGNINV